MNCGTVVDMDFDSPTLVYNEEEYGRAPKNQKAIFIYEWLRNLEDNIATVKKVRLSEENLSLILLFFEPFRENTNQTLS